MNIFQHKRLNDLKKKRKTLGYSSLTKDDINFLNKFEKKTLYSEYSKTEEFKAFNEKQKIDLFLIAALILINLKKIEE